MGQDLRLRRQVLQRAAPAHAVVRAARLDAVGRARVQRLDHGFVEMAAALREPAVVVTVLCNGGERYLND